jgi:tetratricopeptide (TPR) repeat protein
MSEELAGLQEQRDVLLQSLRDLEQERAAGEIDDDDHAVLRDDYTARAAAVLKAIEAARATAGGRRRPGGPSRPAGARPRRPPALRAAAGRTTAGTSRPGARRSPPPADGETAATDATSAGPAGSRSTGNRGAAARRAARANRPVGRGQRTVAVSLIVAFAIVALAGVSVVLFSDGRSGNEPITGSVPGASTAGTSRVDDALALETEGKAVEALQLYDEILASEPDNVEALAYRGWLLKRAGLADEALASLDRAVIVDPTFADAHFFRGMVLYQDRDDPAAAVIEFQAFLANNPPPDFVDAVGEVLAQAQAAAAAKATATTVAP